jgi:imidazolonepropionase-like amidohydrolase
LINTLKIFLAAMILTAMAVAQNAVTPPSDSNKVTVIHAPSLIDGTSDKVRHNVTIVVRGGKIESIGENQKAPAGANVIELPQGTTVLPGMIDTHTHIFLQGEDPAEGGYDVQLLKHPSSFRAARAVVAARRALDQGFTTLRDLETEGAGYGDVGIKEAIEAGYIPGPRLFCVTRAISVTGGYPLEGYNPDVKVPKGAQLVDGPVEARKATREQIENGADWIKVYMTHRSWADKNGNLVSQPTLTLDEIRAVVDEAHGQEHKVACHAYSGIGLHRALDGGCDSIEHGLDLDDAAIQQMLKQGTWYVPTLAVYYHDNSPAGTPEGIRDAARVRAHEASFRKALKAGVKIAFGTDMGGISWSEPIAQEFDTMVKLGMTPMQAIQAATSKAAELLDRKGELGVIATGADADIVAVQGDPTANVGALKDVKFVMKDGKVFKQ